MIDFLRDLNLKDKLKFLLKDSIIYGGAGAISKLFSLFTFPILARHFSIGDYGIVDALTVLSGLLITFLVFGQDSAVARLFYDYEDINEKKSVLSQSLIIQLFFGILAIPILLFFSDQISHNFTGNTKHKFIIELIIYQIPLGVFLNFATNILKWDFKKKQFIFLQLGSTVTYLLCLIVAIYFFSLDIYDVFIILFGVRFIFCIFGFIFIKSWFLINTKKIYFNALMQIALPYGIVCVTTSLIPAIDRFYISKYLTIDDLGNYAVSYKLAFLMMLPINAFQTAWGPFAYAIFNNNDASRTYNSVLLLFTSMICFLGLCISLTAIPLINIFAGIKYEIAHKAVSPLVFGLIFMSLSWIVGIGIDLSKQTYWKIISTSLQLIATLGMIHILVIPFGIEGVALGVLFGYLIYFIWELYISNKLYKIDFSIIKCMILIIVAGLISILGSIIINSSSVSNILFILGLLTLFVIIAWQMLSRELNIISIKDLIK